MGKLNRICLVCGEQYKYCYSCPSDLQNPSWKNLFDNENCKKIFNILCRHGQNMITDEETREQLKECDLSNKEHFNANIQKHLDKVFNVVVDRNIEEVIKEDVVQIKETKKMRPKRKVVEEVTAE